MKFVKKWSFLIALAIVAMLMMGCDYKQGRQNWEYTVVQFDRDFHEQMEGDLERLGNEGWEYAGPLANNGINAQFVAFKRPK